MLASDLDLNYSHIVIYMLHGVHISSKCFLKIVSNKFIFVVVDICCYYEQVSQSIKLTLSFS